jgi:hypothetical protein
MMQYVRRAVFVIGMGLAGCAPSRTQPTTSGDAAAGGLPGRTTSGRAMSEEQKSIGQATMTDDGTIVLDLRAEGPGMRGDARFTYPKTHPQYQKVLEHLGGLKPGEKKPVPPWDD